VSVAEQFETCYTGAVHDVMRGMGLADFTLPPDIRPLLAEVRLVGPLWTFSGRAVDDADPHQTLLEWTRVLGEAPSGHVVACQPNDSALAHMGELSAETLLARGVRGYIVDGGCRDTEFLAKMRFQVFCRYFTPRDIVGAWLPEGLGEPITIGGVAIATGDFVLADGDGIVVIPKDIAVEVAAKTREIMSTENKVRRAILEGMHPREAYLKYGKF
jgi:regulator of RNase E activity RraA